MAKSLLPSILLALISQLLSAAALQITRRQVVAASSSLIWLPTAAQAAKGPKNLENRLLDTTLSQPPAMSTSELNGVDNSYYPEWLTGTWNATQTLVDVQTPLGLQYLGGPNGDVAIAEKSLRESREKISQPVDVQLRFVNTRFGVAEDRLFNTVNRLNAFAGRTVTAKADYADVGGSNRASVLAMGGTRDDPLTTVFVRYKGPAAQKTFLTAHSAEKIDENTFVGSECQRTIFALTNENTAPPIFTDSELIVKYERVDGNTVKGRLRIAGYLNPNQDKLYFQAKKQAVSIQDYTLELRKVT